ncbi:hypothetical protein [Pseudomonas protegens]|uniref:hypothetical protein n=1 Tax=Pseudomonas protegens TaxID=380021 RepID=UPI0027659952|nr:hypothetical protein [Pseudomonas protegens]MDP9530520.1 hypothetical protein [Pseudomonas protegens]
MHSKNKYTLTSKLPIAVAFLGFLALGLGILYNGHPNEDAYILFVYVKNFLNGYGISYYPGGGHAEGATDFLWMALLILTSETGLNVAFSATFLNAVGAALICAIALKILKKELPDIQPGRYGLIFAIAVVLSPIATAAMGGFSTLLYSSIITLMFYIHYKCEKSNFILIPWIGLIISLFRPDGILIGITATVIALFQVDASSRKKYIINTLLAALAGGLYFVSRYYYFGLLWPLPLYVKTTTNSIAPGLYPTFLWLLSMAFIAPATTYYIYQNRFNKRLILALIPAITLIIGFTFINQTQNIASRFQNSIFGILLTLCFIGSIKISKHTKSSYLLFIALMALPITAYTGKYIVKHIIYLTNDDYAYFLPQELNSVTDSDTSILLSEAGRTAYWANGKKIDLVGLNTPEIAKYGVATFNFEEANPDIIFVNTAKTLAVKNCTKGFEKVTPEELSSLRLEVSKNWKSINDPVIKAPGAAIDYITNNPRKFDTYLVCDEGSNYHLYSINRSNKKLTQAFPELLKKSHSPEGRISFIESYKKFTEKH